MQQQLKHDGTDATSDGNTPAVHHPPTERFVGSRHQEVEPAMTRLFSRSPEGDRSRRREPSGVVYQVQYETGPAGLGRRVLARGCRRSGTLGPADRIDESGLVRLGDLDRF
jgi:hypothetical protein